MSYSCGKALVPYDFLVVVASNRLLFWPWISQTILLVRVQFEMVVKRQRFLSTDRIEMNLDDDIKLAPSRLCHFEWGFLDHYRLGTNTLEDSTRFDIPSAGNSPKNSKKLTSVWVLVCVMELEGDLAD